MVTIAIMHKCTILHPLMWVFFWVKMCKICNFFYFARVYTCWCGCSYTNSSIHCPRYVRFFYILDDLEVLDYLVFLCSNCSLSIFFDVNHSYESIKHIEIYVIVKFYLNLWSKWFILVCSSGFKFFAKIVIKKFKLYKI